jgi:membrane dipeptidase
MSDGSWGNARAGEEPATSDRIALTARQLHHDAFVIDLHADTPSEGLLRPRYDFGRRHRTGHIDLPRLREAGVDAQFFIAFVPPEQAERPGQAFAYALRLIRAVHRTVERTPGLALATNRRELAAAAAAGEVAALIGVEGGHAIEASLERLRELHALGARYLTLTWNNNNEWADACCSPPVHGGLTAFGRDVVREMNRLGMIVDVSHVADTTFWQVLEVSRSPIIASHSNARALCAHPRNLTDEQLAALGQSDGLVGVNFYPGFLDSRIAPLAGKIHQRTVALEKRLRRWHHPARASRLARAWRDRHLRRLPAVGMEAVADHLEHMAALAGIEHVALGSDFDGIFLTPVGLEDVTGLPALTELLLRRGFGEDVVRGILGGNFLRLLHQVTGDGSH